MSASCPPPLACDTFPPLTPQDLSAGFAIDSKGHVTVDGISVSSVAQLVNEDHFFLLSLSRIVNNTREYKDAVSELLPGISCILGYAIKANANITIIRHLARCGCGAVLVSGNELRLALSAGIAAEKIVLNGNGKSVGDIEAAAAAGCMINADSVFDLQNILSIAQGLSRGHGLSQPVKVLLRLNPDIDPQVHPYIATGNAQSKFGIAKDHLPHVLDLLRANQELVHLEGLHCHLGSTIKTVTIFHDAMVYMLHTLDSLRAQGFNPRVINVGGGLGIDYARGTQPLADPLPRPRDLIASVAHQLQGRTDVILMLEPGRSLVADACVVVSRVLGVKSNGGKQFLVVSAAMTELIRPALYSAYHHITYASPPSSSSSSSSSSLYDVVGPVCESGDFLGKERELMPPDAESRVVVFDAGAYGFSMSSNYNMRCRPGEYMIAPAAGNGSYAAAMTSAGLMQRELHSAGANDMALWRVRRAETFEHLTATMNCSQDTSAI